MRYLPIESSFFEKNRQKLVSRLKPNSLSIINSNDEMPRSGDQNFPFRQNSDLFYLSGIDQEESILTLCPDHPQEKMREILFLKKTTEEMVIWHGHKYTKEEAHKISGIKNVLWLDEFETNLYQLMINSENVYLNLNENPRFASVVPYRDIRFVKDLKEKYPLHKYERLAPILTALRVIKEPEEIELIKKSCEITKKAFDRILKFVRPGVMEYEIEAEIIHEFIINRANGYAFYPIVASGKNACILHYVENSQQCKEGDLVLIDFGAEYANYASDCTRTIPVNGKYTQRQRAVYEATLRVMRAATKMLVPGTTINKYHENVCKIMEKELIALGLFTEEDVQKQDPAKPMYFKYFMHGTSHFIGMDVHDVGSKDQELKPGMIFSCEPGIYIHEENIGVRIENVILVTEDGPVDLSENIPVEPDEIETLIQQ